MSRFLALLKASVLRERQWEDTRMDGDAFAGDAGRHPPMRDPGAREAAGFPATVPMPLSKQ